MVDEIVQARSDIQTARFDIQKAKEEKEQRQQEAEKVSAELEQYQSKLPQNTQRNLRQRFSGLAGRRQRQTIQKVSQDIETKKGEIEKYKSDLAKYGTDISSYEASVLNPYETSVNEAQAQQEAYNADVEAFTQAQKFYQDRVPLAFVSGAEKKYLKEMYDAGTQYDEYVANVNQLNREVTQKISDVNAGLTTFDETFSQSYLAKIKRAGITISNQPNADVQSIIPRLDRDTKNIIPKDIPSFTSTGFSVLSVEATQLPPVQSNNLTDTLFRTTGSPIKIVNLSSSNLPAIKSNVVIDTRTGRPFGTLTEAPKVSVLDRVVNVLKTNPVTTSTVKAIQPFVQGGREFTTVTVPTIYKQNFARSSLTLKSGESYSPEFGTYGGIVLPSKNYGTVNIRQPTPEEFQRLSGFSMEGVPQRNVLLVSPRQLKRYAETNPEQTIKAGIGQYTTEYPLGTFQEPTISTYSAVTTGGFLGSVLPKEGLVTIKSKERVIPQQFGTVQYDPYTGKEIKITIPASEQNLFTSGQGKVTGEVVGGVAPYLAPYGLGMGLFVSEYVPEINKKVKDKTLTLGDVGFASLILAPTIIRGVKATGTVLKANKYGKYVTQAKESGGWLEQGMSVNKYNEPNVANKITIFATKTGDEGLQKVELFPVNKGTTKNLEAYPQDVRFGTFKEERYVGNIQIGTDVEGFVGKKYETFTGQRVLKDGKFYEEIDYGNIVKQTNTEKGTIKLFDKQGKLLADYKINPSKSLSTADIVKKIKPSKVTYDANIVNPYDIEVTNINSPLGTLRSRLAKTKEGQVVVDITGSPIIPSPIQSKKIYGELNTQGELRINPLTGDISGVQSSSFFSDVIQVGDRKASLEVFGKGGKGTIKRSIGQEIVEGTPKELDIKLRKSVNGEGLGIKYVSPKIEKELQAAEGSNLYLGYVNPKSKNFQEMLAKREESFREFGQNIEKLNKERAKRTKEKFLGDLKEKGNQLLSPLKKKTITKNAEDITYVERPVYSPREVSAPQVSTYFEEVEYLATPSGKIPSVYGSSPKLGYGIETRDINANYQPSVQSNVLVQDLQTDTQQNTFTELGLKTDQKIDTKLKTFQESPTRLREESRIKELTKTQTKELTKTQFKELLILKTEQQLKQEQKTEQKTQQRTRTEQSSRTGTPKQPRFRFKVPSEKSSKSATQQVSDLYEVFVKKKGQDVSIGEFEGLGKAKGELFGELRKSLRAGGYISKGGQKVKVELFGTGFTPSKKDSFRVIQPKGKRLSAKSETKEIQFLKGKRNRSSWGF